jgi:hypothetical protein
LPPSSSSARAPIPSLTAPSRSVAHSSASRAERTPRIASAACR